MPKFTVKPLAGRKDDVPPDDRNMLTILDQAGTTAISHEADGENTSYNRQRGAVSKSYGYEEYSNSAITSYSGCNGLYELYDGTNRDNLFFDKGQVFYMDSNLDPVALTDAIIDFDGQTGNFELGETITTASGGTAVVGQMSDAGSTGTLYLQTVVSGSLFYDDATLSGSVSGYAMQNGALQTTTYATDPTGLYSMDTYGSYLVFSDNGEHTPQIWRNGDNKLVPLIPIGGGTQYKFKYVVVFRGRIIGVYSDQTDGDLEMRWTNILPNVQTLTFPSANQLYMPGSDSITGISRLGSDNLYIYTLDSIYMVSYYPDGTPIFGINPAVADQGCASHHSIVNVAGYNYFFNRNLGFVRYDGGARLTEDYVISKNIDGYIRDIDQTYMSRIVGKHIPYTDEIVWLVPGDGGSADLLVYDRSENRWTIQDKGNSITYIDAWTVSAGEGRNLVFAKNDGKVYSGTGDTYGAESSFDGFRIEPIMDFGDKEIMKLLVEIWFGIHTGGNYNLHVYWRGGDTVKEVLAASWTALDTLNLNSPSNPTVYCAKAARFHQIKYGTDGLSEPFSINNVVYTFNVGGKY